MRNIVLLSAFNGRDHIEEQLTSILNQLPSDGLLLIRDDGSSDGTPELIETIKDARIVLVRGANIGFCQSFFALVDAAPDENAAYFFADQDDIWLPDKLARASQHLAMYQQQMFLYCSRAHLVDEALRPLGMTPLFQKAKTLRHALTENIATGCTVAFNQPLLQALKQTEARDFIAFHDWWAYVMATTFGSVHFDPTPTVLYRQHAKNAIGMKSGIGRYISIVRYLRRNNWLRIMNRQIWALRQNHWHQLASIHQQEMSALQSRSGRVRRMAIITSVKSMRTGVLSDILLRALTLLDLRPTKIERDR
ncbi:glycosyltransferase [Aquabacterium sp.]|uniref:glycosyltransferase n=1 Tax=Aquabacterium sp. TaxID=1872578 RepID=UPI0025C71432|nr:glycosyltransferase [Aquabacterium sp.]